MSQTIQVNKHRNYESLNQNDPDIYKDKFIEEQEKAKLRKEELTKTNLYKSRIIGKISILII